MEQDGSITSTRFQFFMRTMVSSLHVMSHQHKTDLKRAEIEGFTKKWKHCELYHSSSYLLRYSKPIITTCSCTTAKKFMTSKSYQSYSGFHLDNAKTKITNCRLGQEWRAIAHACLSTCLKSFQGCCYRTPWP